MLTITHPEWKRDLQMERIIELEAALRDLLDGCVALDPEQAILSRQMEAARQALERDLDGPQRKERCE